MMISTAEIKRIIFAVLSRTRKYLDRSSPIISYLRFLKNRLAGVRFDKKAFLVLGPESHGSHLVTDVLLNAGCVGHAGNHVPWQPENKVLLRGLKKPWEYEFPTDLQPWDNRPPTIENPIVWRRSLPHGKKWINLSQMARDLWSRGYQVQVVVVSRDTHSGLQSQLKWRHVRDLETGKANISQAYLHIFRHLLKTRLPFTVVNYESLAYYPKAQDFMLEQLDLPLPERRWPIYDGNRKWHDNQLNDNPADFPEGWYPCKAGNADTYFQRVADGYRKMKEQDVIICGLARDIIESLPKVMAKIEHLGKLFKTYRVVVVENDSEDGTREMLQYWQQTNPRVEILSQELGAYKWDKVQDIARTEAMANYRNQYLDHIQTQGYDFDYLVVFDLDIPLGFSYDGIAHSFSYKDWDVVSSNGILVPPYGNPIDNPVFFDAFAFRQKDLTEPADIATINTLQFQRGEELLAVESAFGGLAIYRSAGIKAGVRYEGYDCEHVVLHERLRDKGYDQQFLNPSQIVLYSGS
ncbi:MAG: hypothetical protein AAFZ63_04705 [Bacteroidota bacterium]